MGMMLRRRGIDKKNLTTKEVLHSEPETKATESVKDEKPMTVKRGRPTTKK